MAGIAMRLCRDELEDVAKIRVVLQKEGERELDRRLWAISLVGRGTTMKETARICEVGSGTIRRWIDTYRTHGLWVLISKRSWERNARGCRNPGPASSSDARPHT
jgi:hypothetical protein